MSTHQKVNRPRHVLNQFISTNGAVVPGNSVYKEVHADGNSSPSFGSEVIFRLKKFGKMILRNSSLRVSVSALTAASGTPRWTNALGVNIFDRIEIHSGGNVLHTLNSSTAWKLLKASVDKQHYDEVISDNIADASGSDRDTLAGSSQILHFPLGNFFHFLAASFPVHFLETHSTEIHVHLRALDDVVEAGTTPSASINNIELDLLMTDGGPALEQRLAEIKNNNQALLPYGIRSGGWAINSTRFEHYKTNVASGADDVAFTLSGLNNKKVKALIFSVHTNSDLNGAVYTSPIAISSFALKSGNTYIDINEEDTTDDFYKKVILQHYKVPGRDNLVSDNIYMIPYTDHFAAEFDNGQSKKSSFGARDFSGINDAQLEVNFSSSLGSAHTLQVSALVEQLDIAKDGQLKPVNTSQQ